MLVKAQAPERLVTMIEINMKSLSTCELRLRALVTSW